MLKRLVPPLVLLFVAMAHGVMAQEKGQVGLNLGYPTIGLTWQASNAIAVRPAFLITHASSSNTSTLPPSVLVSSGGSTSDSTTWAASIGALFYVRKWEKVSAYVTPMFAYQRSTSSASSQLSTGTTSNGSGSGNYYSFAGSIGGQYSLGRKFSVFGEVGYGYTHQTNTSTSTQATLSSTNSNTSNSWSPRSAVGVILYFN